MSIFLIFPLAYLGISSYNSTTILERITNNHRLSSNSPNCSTIYPLIRKTFKKATNPIVAERLPLIQTQID